LYFRSTYSAAKSHSRVFRYFTLFWFAGILSGFALSNHFSSELLQKDLMNGSGSFFGLVISAVVPVLLCALFATYHLDPCACIVCFLKAFLQGFYLWSFSSSVGSLHYYLTGSFFLQCCCCTLMLFSYFHLRSIDRKRAVIYIPSVVTVCLILCFVIILSPEFI